MPSCSTPITHTGKYAGTAYSTSFVYSLYMYVAFSNDSSLVTSVLIIGLILGLVYEVYLSHREVCHELVV